MLIKRIACTNLFARSKFYNASRSFASRALATYHSNGYRCRNVAAIYISKLNNVKKDTKVNIKYGTPFKKLCRYTILPFNKLLTRDTKMQLSIINDALISTLPHQKMGLPILELNPNLNCSRILSVQTRKSCRSIVSD